MEQKITKDGSITFYNAKSQEHYHSLTGAREEAIKKYAEAVNLTSGKIIFDICFGLGYNSAAALEKGRFTIYCFENDNEILKKILKINVDFKHYKMIKEFVRGYFQGNVSYQKDGITLKMMFGDVRQNIKLIKEKADFVFFDPFSPSKVPEMWTKELFKDIYLNMNNMASLCTYSCAGWIRKNMTNAGFVIKDGPIVGRNSPSTIGIKKVTEI